MEASTVNTPHPDDTADEFFGDLSVEETATSSVVADPQAEEIEPEPEEEDPAPGVINAEAVTAATEAAEAAVAKKRGSVNREYRVFHRLPLTEKALTFLLKQVQEGRQPEPRIAYFEVAAFDERNAVSAIARAYKEHEKILGEKADMAAVSAKSFQERHVEPKERPVERMLSIT